MAARLFRWLVPPLLTGFVLLGSAAAASTHQSGAGWQPGEATEYRLWYRNYDSPAIRAALQLAFDKTPEYGPYRIVRSPEMVQGRALVELRADDRNRLVTIANVATSPDREASLYAIPLPIDGGLLGLRVCVVKDQDVTGFAGVRSVDDLALRGLSVGQGSHWPDTAILRANRVTVVTHTRFETLFTMVQRGRFDCFARGVSEVLFDLESVQHQGLVIEPHLLLAYPMPSYFFVGPGDHDTAQRIELGLKRAIHDGSFAHHLEHFYGRAVEELGLHQREMLVLDNPFLSDESGPIGRRTLETLRQRISSVPGQDHIPALTEAP